MSINKDADDDWNIFNFGNIYGDNSIKDEKKTNPDNCFHKWIKYVGFTEMYYYCEYCDKKSNNDYESAQKPWLK